MGRITRRPVCSSVRLSVLYGLPTGVGKNKVSENVLNARRNQCANFQLKVLKVGRTAAHYVGK